MLYTLNLDKDNYILSIANTDKDDIELDLASMDLDYLNCYKYDGTLSFDEEKKKIRIAEKEEQEKNNNHNEAVLEQINKLAEKFIENGENSNDFIDRIEAQILYTALMTDSIIESEEE